MRRVLISSLVTVVLVGAGAIPVAALHAAGSAAIARPRTTPPPKWTDFDNDGFADLAIGAPYDDVGGLAGAGTVNVLYGSASGLVTTASQVWHQDRPNVANAAEAGDHFGWALANGDFDGDTFADLAIGVPDEDVGGDANRGGINVLFGSATGLVARSTQLFVTDGDMPAGAQLGYALTGLDMRNTGTPMCAADADDVAELAAGAPGDGPNDQGSVRVFVGSFLVSAGEPCGQGLTKIVGQTNGAAAGRALAAGDIDGDQLDDLAVGVPLEDVTVQAGTVVNAGAVRVLGGANLELLAVWEQGNFILQTAEQNDRFGAALAMADLDFDGIDEIAVGVPGEDLPAGADAGLVHVRSALGAETLFTSNSAGVPGTASAGEKFGSALAFGNFEAAREGNSLAVGMAGDTVGGHPGAGAVVVIYNDGSGLGTTNNDRWHQDSPGILDTAETGDAFGSALYPADFDADGDMDLAIGVPRENIGAVADAGAVAVLYAVTPGTQGFTATGDDFWHQDVPGLGEIAQTGDRFGAGLP